MFSHSLPLGPPSPTLERAMRRAGLSPMREEGKWSFREKENWALGTTMPRKGHHDREPEVFPSSAWGTSSLPRLKPNLFPNICFTPRGWERTAGTNPNLVSQSKGCHPAPSCSPPASVPPLLLGQAWKRLQVSESLGSY